MFIFNIARRTLFNNSLSSPIHDPLIFYDFTLHKSSYFFIYVQNVFLPLHLCFSHLSLSLTLFNPIIPIKEMLGCVLSVCRKLLLHKHLERKAIAIKSLVGEFFNKFDIIFFFSLIARLVFQRDINL